MNQFKVGDEVEVALMKDSTALYFGEYGAGEYPEDFAWVPAKVLRITGLHYVVVSKFGNIQQEDKVLLEGRLERSRGEWPSIRPRQPKDTLLSDLRMYLKERILTLRIKANEAYEDSDRPTACYLDGQVLALEDVLAYLAYREEKAQ